MAVSATFQNLKMDCRWTGQDEGTAPTALIGFETTGLPLRAPVSQPPTPLLCV